jgi:hypothetical protein
MAQRQFAVEPALHKLQCGTRETRTELMTGLDAKKTATSCSVPCTKNQITSCVHRTTTVAISAAASTNFLLF